MSTQITHSSTVKRPVLARTGLDPHTPAVIAAWLALPGHRRRGGLPRDAAGARGIRGLSLNAFARY
jgi:hypothetical protein